MLTIVCLLQRYRVFKQLALAYAMKFTGKWMIERFKDLEVTIRLDFTLSDICLLHLIREARHLVRSLTWRRCPRSLRRALVSRHTARG